MHRYAQHFKGQAYEPRLSSCLVARIIPSRLPLIDQSTTKQSLIAADKFLHGKPMSHQERTLMHKNVVLRTGAV